MCCAFHPHLAPHKAWNWLGIGSRIEGEAAPREIEEGLGRAQNLRNLGPSNQCSESHKNPALWNLWTFSKASTPEYIGSDPKIQFRFPFPSICHNQWMNFSKNLTSANHPYEQSEQKRSKKNKPCWNSRINHRGLPFIKQLTMPQKASVASRRLQPRLSWLVVSRSGMEIRETFPTVMAPNTSYKYWNNPIYRIYNPIYNHL